MQIKHNIGLCNSKYILLVICCSRIVDVLLEHNATVKGSKMTPLHVAMKQTSAGYHVVETLLRRQPPAFNVNSRDVDGQTPLHYAAVYYNDHPHVIKLLLDRLEQYSFR